MSDIRMTLRNQYKEESGHEPSQNLSAYADWLELRFIRKPEEEAKEQMETALRNASVALDIARLHVRTVFNKKE